MTRDLLRKLLSVLFRTVSPRPFTRHLDGLSAVIGFGVSFGGGGGVIIPPPAQWHSAETLIKRGFTCLLRGCGPRREAVRPCSGVKIVALRGPGTILVSVEIGIFHAGG